MKTWAKVTLGLGALAAAIGGAVAIIGKRNANQDDEYVLVEEETNNDSDSDYEAE